MFGTLNDSDIENLISTNVVGRLGCHADGETYIVPISYAYDGNYIYGRTFEGKKILMMRKNPNVCFQIDLMKDMADWQSVIAWGTFEELTHETERNEGLKKLISRILPNIASETMKFTSEWPFPTQDYNRIEGIVFRIKITKKSGRFERLEYTFPEK